VREWPTAMWRQGLEPCPPLCGPHTCYKAACCAALCPNGRRACGMADACCSQEPHRAPAASVMHGHTGRPHRACAGCRCVSACRGRARALAEAAHRCRRCCRSFGCCCCCCHACPCRCPCRRLCCHAGPGRRCRQARPRRAAPAAAAAAAPASAPCRVCACVCASPHARAHDVQCSRTCSGPVRRTPPSLPRIGGRVQHLARTHARTHARTTLMQDNRSQSSSLATHMKPPGLRL
jgi:hypothetical protein